MNISHDKKADAVYLRLAEAKIIESEEVAPGIIYDFDENEQVVGVEILKLKYRTLEQIQAINLPFTAEDRNLLKEFLSLEGVAA